MVWVPEKKQLLDLLVNHGTTSEASADEVQRRWGELTRELEIAALSPRDFDGTPMGPPGSPDPSKITRFFSAIKPQMDPLMDQRYSKVSKYDFVRSSLNT